MNPASHAESALVIRDATGADFDSIASIYTHYVLHALATFEEVPPDATELRKRHAAIAGAGLPYLVAEAADGVVGYAYATPYRPRSAYRHTIEDSVYIAQDWHGRGLGRQLLEALIARCEAGPWRQLIAVIGNGHANTGSVALHARLGFSEIGVLRNVGYKQGGWVDTVLMQRPLGGEKPPIAHLL